MDSVLLMPGIPEHLGTVLPHGFSLRQIDADDQPFLSALYASTRQEELSSTGWTEAEKTTFLSQQFTWQHSFYQQHFSDAAFYLLLRDGAPIGRIYWLLETRVLRLIDIALLPAERGQGLGSLLIKALMDAAANHQRRLQLHVEHFNPARQLYARLGFQQIAENGVYHQMEWSAP